MSKPIIKEGAFIKGEQKYVFQVRSDGHHLVWGHGLVPYKDQFKVDDVSHKIMTKLMGKSAEEASRYFERLVNASSN